MIKIKKMTLTWLLGAIANIRIKRFLNVEQKENVMKEVNIVVNRHIKSARASETGIFKLSATCTITQWQQRPHQQPQQQQNLPLMQCRSFPFTEFESIQIYTNSSRYCTMMIPFIGNHSFNISIVL